MLNIEKCTKNFKQRFIYSTKLERIVDANRNNQIKRSSLWIELQDADAL